MRPDNVKELEIRACKIFVCPNLDLIDIKGKELLLSEETIRNIKNLAILYFKKTYHNPRYSSAKHLIPAFVYIGSILGGERRYQSEIASIFNSSSATIRKWSKDIILELKLAILVEDGEVQIPAEFSARRIKFLNGEGEFVCPDLSILETDGKLLNLRDETIDRAKDLAVKYLEKTCKRPTYSSVDTLFPSLLYIASIVENDRIRQIDIAIALHVSETSISQWSRNIMYELGLKIIYTEDRHVAHIIKNEH